MVIPESFLALTNLFPEPLLFVTADGTLLAANQAARQTLPLVSHLPLDQQYLTEWVTEPPEKLLKFLHLCARNWSMVPGVFTLRHPSDGSNISFYVEGGVIQPRSGDAVPILLLRWRPRQQATHKFIELTEKIEQLSRGMFLREKAAAENARLYKAEQQARRAAEEATKRITSLQRVTAALARAVTPGEVIEVIIEQGLASVNASAGAVMLLDEAGTALNIVHAVGYPKTLIKAAQNTALSQPAPSTEAVRFGQPVWLASHREFVERYSERAANRSNHSQQEAAAVMPLPGQDKVLGVLTISFKEVHHFSQEEKDFLVTLANQCAQALERARLYEIEQQARAEAEANQQRLAILAEMRERNRMAQELHDTVAQALGYLNLKIAATSSSLDQDGMDTAKANLQELKQVVAETYTDVREEIFNLRAKVMAGMHFMEVLERYIDKYRRFYNLEIQCVQEADPALFDFPPEVTTQLIRTIQEALINIRKHTRVQTATIRLGQENGTLCISIEDQGQGFDPDRTKAKTSSFGLQIMRERVESIGWHLEVATAPGQGTRIILHGPI